MRATAFTELVGCELPIQQAPVGFPAAEIDLPLAVARAGGHGMLAGVGMPETVLAQRIEALRADTRAFGVNLIAPLASETHIDAAAAAPLVELYMGPADPERVRRAAAGGALVSWQVVSAEEARVAEAAGCDLVVARGIEAGGRAPGGIGLLPLLDAVLEAVSVPVVAAGGIATRRAVAAVLAAGAAGARVGTRFLCAEEAATHPVYRDALLAAHGADAVLSDAFSVGAPPGPARVLRSALEAAAAAPQDEPIATLDLGGARVEVPRFSPFNPHRSAEGRVEAMALYAGQGVGAVRRVEPAAAIVADLAGLS